MAWWDGNPVASTGTGIPYRPEYGGFGADPLQAQNMYDQLNGNSWDQLSLYGKLGAVGQGVNAFSSLANLYAGFKALRLQEKQFDFARDAWNKNYNNQVKDYENTLKDRWAARNASASARGGSYDSMASWVGNRSLTGQPAGG